MKLALNKPALGVVSQSAHTFTLYYYIQNGEPCECQGYDWSVFDNCPANTPILQMDKLDHDAAMRIVVGVSFRYTCTDFQKATCADKPEECVNLDQYLALLRANGAVIQTLRECMDELSDTNK